MYENAVGCSIVGDVVVCFESNTERIENLVDPNIAVDRGHSVFFRRRFVVEVWLDADDFVVVIDR